MNKQELIEKIIPLIQNTHNDEDISDLQTFSLDELNEIYNDVIDWICGQQQQHQKLNAYEQD